MKILILTLCLLCSCASRPKTSADDIAKLKAEIKRSFHSAENFGFTTLHCNVRSSAAPQIEFELNAVKDSVNLKIIRQEKSKMKPNKLKEVIQTANGHLNLVGLYLFGLEKDLMDDPNASKLRIDKSKNTLLFDYAHETAKHMVVEIDPSLHTVLTKMNIENYNLKHLSFFAKHFGSNLITKVETGDTYPAITFDFDYSESTPIATLGSLRVTSNISTPIRTVYSFKNCKLSKPVEANKTLSTQNN